MPSGAFRKKKTSFAQVSNTALRDEKLSLKAKGLLALIESYLSLESFTLYKQFLINKSTDGETSFRSAWRELKDRGYLIQYKLKDENTKQFYYEYEICDNPDVESPHVDFPPVGNPVGSLTTRQETPLYNNNINNNNLIINTIQTNIDYDTVFVHSADKELVDNIINIIADILIVDYDIVKINGGEIKGNVLRTILLKVNMNHVLYTVNVIREYTGKINNMRSFILSVLYNSVLTIDSYYQNLVNEKGW